MAMRNSLVISACGILMVLVVTVMGGCTLSPLENRTVTRALDAQESAQTALGQEISVIENTQNEKSGVYIIGDPQLAFAARILLSQRAEKTMDLQYYIWEADVTGTLMFETIVDAANRGVRVRLLLDDNGIEGLDDAFFVLNNHANIEVRIFNPFVQRKLKWLGYITHFNRVNRRMHNKSFTVDNVATVIGGRNIADDYFGATEHVLKEDIDVIAVGEIVSHVSTDFDIYWASLSAYPIDQLLNVKDDAQYSTGALFPSQLNNPERNAYIELIKESSIIDALTNGKLSFTWAKVDMISDSPTKTLHANQDEDLLVFKLHQVIGQPSQGVLIISPYFVPTKAAVTHFVELAEQGINVSILTNSMQATDVLPVHAGYAKHRKTLLRAGVSLFELKSTRANENRLKDKLGPFGSSASSLHAKLFAIDDERLFIGSFNFDPRSINLNTELGFVIHSNELTEQVNAEFAQHVRSAAYELVLTEDEDIIWKEIVDGELKYHESEPGLGIVSGVALSILSVLPIDSLL